MAEAIFQYAGALLAPAIPTFGRTMPDTGAMEEEGRYASGPDWSRPVLVVLRQGKIHAAKTSASCS
jgi:hypothetical protein